MKRLIFTLFICMNLISCNQNKEEISEVKSSVITRRVDYNEYIDVTNKDVNASLLKKSDFAVLSYGTYINGNSYINIDFEKGRVKLYTDNCMYESLKGKSLEAEFVYNVKSANMNTLYLSPTTLYNLTVKVDNKEVKASVLPSFLLYVPLFGFGQSRLEVSSILNGEIGLPSGTYWKQ